MSISSVDSGPLHIKPEIDLNLTTQANRIMYVFNKIIRRTTLVGLLKILTKDDGLLLKGALDINKAYYILQTCDRYFAKAPQRQGGSFIRSQSSTEEGDSWESGGTNSEVESRSVSISLSEKSDESKTKFNERSNKSLCRVLYLLESNEEIQKIIKEMENNVSPQIKFFLRCLLEMKHRMEIRLNETASQYKARERYIRETYSKNERAKKEIEKMEEELVVTKTDANVCLIGRNILINRHQRKIEKIKQSSQEAIDKRVKESEKVMVNDWKKSVVNQERLQNEYMQASEKFSNLLKDHLATEKILRAKKTKVENQVLGWIQKFDQDVGEKQAEEEEIQTLLEQETNKIHEIQAKLQEQEDDYDELMQEKAEYEEEMLERRLYKFIMNRSARKIQRTFRMYKARKLAKKLAKKGKKGKKKKANEKK